MPGPTGVALQFTLGHSEAIPSYIIAIQSENIGAALGAGDSFGEMLRSDGSGCFERYYPCGADLSLTLEMQMLTEELTEGCFCLDPAN